jgi:hypothetical protein
VAPEFVVAAVARDGPLVMSPAHAAMGEGEFAVAVAGYAALDAVGMARSEEAVDKSC